MPSQDSYHIALLEPFFGGSHQRWAQSFSAHSQHQVDIFPLSGKHWKWRMHGGAISLSRAYLEQARSYDLILATDMLDLTTFLALTRQDTHALPVVLYFHENQITYPWSQDDPDVDLARDYHYGFINFTSAIAADELWFNSQYHLNSFFEALPRFLKAFPDKREGQRVFALRKKARVMPLGLELPEPHTVNLSEKSPQGQPPLIVWNHRWEYDKAPTLFFEALFEMTAAGIDFRLAVLGEQYQNQPEIFEKARHILDKQIVHWGYVETVEEYRHWLQTSDLLLVTSIHDFFGASVVEAMAHGVIPILPHRLAYPEHIPNKLHELYLYQSQTHMMELLKRQCTSPDRSDLPQIIQHLQSYHWPNLIQTYDRRLSQLVVNRLS
ncbi:DUF3524 domain-containing protein [Pontibacter sp. G13]|uniref:tRNA-queuosine alpha-mannosyltransferase domain-containing protein n=1 Tax=Pontibacter sp. G13 TaxID=3074898 RepID=UPI00288A33FB|nr:DUF3524 domain-containing protein [Pontibacter sp. G13]WNJ20419.1 DUF3524 domain-containing protein [Pontibacter sp. G13]